ncbi:unnamed protein product [Dimorphilus gyrociliatus]|uniref:Enoyl reductase (ER) domain-containing protein n=1 Tax=Dimorphilus gyrociliatus TaxID=2664684 RepID=A0A7I8WE17_9ANNE|nr:unnamed protein product [Dimorphilus gyrociliatus]
MATMKAMICNGYGAAKDVFELKTVSKPVPRDNEILVKIHATMTTSGDCKLRGYKEIPASLWLPARLSLGLFRPKNPIWGLCFAGEVETVGKKVELFKKGDQVFGSPESAFGAYAQFICLPETGCIVQKPKNLSYKESVSILFGTETAIQFLERAKIQRGQKVLVYGASGSVGVATVQMAKYYGATVTGVCSTKNLEMVKSMGADYVIDYTKKNFRGNGEKYDIIFDTVGKLSYSSCKNSLNPTGYYLMALFSLTGILHQLWRSIIGGPNIICRICGAEIDVFHKLRELAESGEITPVIDRTYSLQEIADAHIYVETGRKKGNVVIEVNHDE